jgi:AmmeMemoRadiSam system protein A
MPDNSREKLLTSLARAAITRSLGQPANAPPDESWLNQPGAAFVTLTLNGQLRGCIGSLSAWRSLHEDVEANARAAAFNDPRFPPLTEAELAHVRVEISLLSVPEPMTFTDEADAVRQLRPRVDGAILTWRNRRGTFLPQVWDQLPVPTQFMANLKRKAGLEADFWAPDIQLARYTVEKFKEPA